VFRRLGRAGTHVLEQRSGRTLKPGQAVPISLRERSPGRRHASRGFGRRVLVVRVRGLSSAGRATESHSVGHRFDPDRLHQNPGRSPVFWPRLSSLTCAPLRGDRLHHAVLRRSRRTAERQVGALAQLGERVLCKHEVTGSIPVGSTKIRAEPGFWFCLPSLWWRAFGATGSTSRFDGGAAEPAGRSGERGDRERRAASFWARPLRVGSSGG
jgi:hypothetical protein